MITKASVDSFLNSKNFAVVGVSGKSSMFGNTIYKELKKKGISVFGVNTNLENFLAIVVIKILKIFKVT